MPDRRTAPEKMFRPSGGTILDSVQTKHVVHLPYLSQILDMVPNSILWVPDAVGETLLTYRHVRRVLIWITGPFRFRIHSTVKPRTVPDMQQSPI